MKICKIIAAFFAVLGLFVLAFNVEAAPAVSGMAAGLPAMDPSSLIGLALAGTVGDMDAIMKALDGIESKMAKFAEKAELEEKAGTISTETKNAIAALGDKQKELADEILQLKQKGAAGAENPPEAKTPGELFVKSEDYKHVQAKMASNTRLGFMGLDVKNTITNTVGNTYSDRRDGVVGGAFRPLLLESLLATLPTSSNAIDYVRENVFTNSAAEVAEGSDSAESAITFTAVQEPVCNIAHWVKISRQLAADNAALAAYINTRLIYGVNLKVENQIIAGNGTAPNLSGFTKSGNYTAHGYADANLGTVLKKLVLIRKIIGDLDAASFPADAILLNHTDWAQIEIDLFTTAAGQALFTVDAGGNPILFGRRVVPTAAVTADNVLVASLANAATFYNREDVTIEMSDSDDDNFTKRLVTVLASRRCALAVDRPAAVRYGDITPA
ncbi:phage major capsid protein [Methylomonas sp. MED-D]|uniref:phage major capsid protein n=1 Tax=Methylomonas sp. MED-D TaxID=3418768 RepID=UPI003D0844CE